MQRPEQVLAIISNVMVADMSAGIGPLELVLTTGMDVRERLLCKNVSDYCQVHVQGTHQLGVS